MFSAYNSLFSTLIKFFFIYYFSAIVLLKCLVAFLGDYLFLPNIVFFLNLFSFLSLVSISLLIYIHKFTCCIKNIYVNLFLFLFIYMILILLYNAIFGEVYITEKVLLFQFKVIAYALLNLLLGVYFYRELEVKEINKIFIYMFILYTLFIIFNINPNTLVFKIDYISGEHQLFSDVFVIFSCFIVFFIKSKVRRLLLMTFLLVILFLIKSRATFFSFLVVYIFFVVKEIGIRNSIYLFLLLIIISLIVIVNDDFSLDRRMFGVFQGKNDGSLTERIEQFKYGVEAIRNNWFWGEYAGQVVIHESGYKGGTMGTYMHNALSFWRQYGIVFFLLFCSTYLFGFYKLLQAWLQSPTLKVQFIFYVSLFLVIELLLFRSYTFPYFWFSLGLMYTHLYHEKSGKA